MKRIFLIRHAKSSWAHPELVDHDRPLNKRGFRDAPFMAVMLKEKYPILDSICTSTALRAKTTAEYFANSYGIEDEHIHLYPELFHAGLSQILSVIGILPNTYKHVAIFGHNPGWTWFANTIPDVQIDNIPTCGIAVIRTPIDSWVDFDIKDCVLESFYYPKQFIR